MLSLESITLWVTLASFFQIEHYWQARANLLTKERQKLANVLFWLGAC